MQISKFASKKRPTKSRLNEQVIGNEQNKLVIKQRKNKWGWDWAK